MQTKTILFAVLDWGLGHATRSAVIIDELLVLHHHVIIASSGNALAYLQSRYPYLKTLVLSDYTLTYATNAKNWKTNLLLQSGQLFRQYQNDKLFLKAFLSNQHVDLIISDNRPSIVDTQIPSVYITHQLLLPKGWGSSLANFIHQRLYHKYHQIWVPDVSTEPNLAGYLSRKKASVKPTHYLGLLSNYCHRSHAKEFDYTAILSGPEPQRSKLEAKLVEVFTELKGNKLIVRGSSEPYTDALLLGKKTCLINLANNNELASILERSSFVICRSGYSSIMDLVSANACGVLVPTPGQPEQEYLAKHMQKNGWFNIITQNAISVQSLENASGQMLQPPSLQVFNKDKLVNLLNLLFSA